MRDTYGCIMLTELFHARNVSPPPFIHIVKQEPVATEDDLNKKLAVKMSKKLQQNTSKREASFKGVFGQRKASEKSRFLADKANTLQ